MADVRTLLRNERVSRRISHPHVSYTKSGQVRCNICNLFLKSEVLWDGHSRSKNHRKNVQAASNGHEGPLSKKRKLEDDEEETRKRSRAMEGMPEDFFDNGGGKPKKGQEDSENGDTTVITPPERELAPPSEPKTTEQPAPKPPEPAMPVVDEDEWAAFEREVAPLAQERPMTDQYAAATISAAPMTAAEVAAQEEAAKRTKREEEAEDEKEDGERRMEEEFDIMDEMEERVRKWKEKREALRTGAKTSHAVQDMQVSNHVAEDEPDPSAPPDLVHEDGKGGESGDEDTDDDEEVDSWGFY
ncbi:MAG: hypothetical protein Q9227_002027 [Pyrenula ochraceoflavens]